MVIYDILKTKPHDPRYLKRYVRFIETRSQPGAVMERHHICPRAADMFPEYSSFKLHPWNRIDLTPREHYIAHLLLWKTYGGSQAKALWFMAKKSPQMFSSKVYAQLRDDKDSRRHTSATKAKISRSLLGNTRAKGKTRDKVWSFNHSEETREAIRQSKLGRKRKPFSEETKAKMKAAQQARRMKESSQG